MILFVLYFYLSRVTNMTFTYRAAAGLWWEDRFRPLVLTAVNLFLNLVLVRKIGMYGVLFSTVFCTVFISVPWGTIILFKKYFKKSPKAYFERIILYLFVTSVVSALTLLLCNFFPSNGWEFLIVKGIICLIVPNILFWIILRNIKEYSYMVVLVNRLRNKILAR